MKGNDPLRFQCCAEVITAITKESSLGYVTTLAYPTMVIAMALFFFGYWVMEPTWRKIAKHYRMGSCQRESSARLLKLSKRR